MELSIGIENDIKSSTSKLDMNQHYIQNKTNVENLDRAWTRILNEINRKITYFNNSAFSYPTFCWLENDI